VAVGTLDFCKAINRAWDASSLNATFRAEWSDPSEDAYFVLNDQIAPDGQPWPYVVMDEPTYNVVQRHSSTKIGKKREIRDIEVVFHVHTKEGNVKEKAGGLAGAIMEVFGGHSGGVPVDLTLDHGNHLVTQLQNEYGVWTEGETYQWTIMYLFRIDVPIAV